MLVTDSDLVAIWREDLPLMDATVDALGIAGRPGAVRCHPKKDGFVWGVEWAARLFELAGCRVEEKAGDGCMRFAGETVLRISGTAERIHSVYKTAQNIMEYGSGIAGRVHQMLAAAKAANPRVQVAVTRKNFPGTKRLSLAAALAGGAIVHRAGLSESLLVFDQHRVFCENVPAALSRARAIEPEKKLCVECGTPEEGLEFVRAGADIIQCERFAPDVLAAFVKDVRALNPGVIVNAAGGVNGENAAQYAAAGADVLVTTWPYFGRPFDIKMAISAA